MKVCFTAADVQVCLKRLTRVVPSLRSRSEGVRTLRSALASRRPDDRKLAAAFRTFAASFTRKGDRPGIRATRGSVIVTAPEGMKLKFTRRRLRSKASGDGVRTEVQFSEHSPEGSDPRVWAKRRIAWFDWVRSVTAVLRPFAGTKTDPVDEHALRELRGLKLPDVPV